MKSKMNKQNNCSVQNIQMVLEDDYKILQNSSLHKIQNYID